MATPTKYTPKLGAEILDMIAGGSNSKKIAMEMGVTPMTVRNWMHKNHKVEYVNALEMRAEAYVDELIDLEDRLLKGEITSNDYREIKDRIKWQSARENRSLYGDTPVVQINNEITLGQALDNMEPINGTINSTKRESKAITE